MEIDEELIAGRNAIKRIEELLGKQPNGEREKIVKDIETFTSNLLIKYGESEPYYDIEKLKKVVNDVFATKQNVDNGKSSYDRALEDGAYILKELLNNKLRL